jgi:tricarballylate dehydrogenase
MMPTDVDVLVVGAGTAAFAAAVSARQRGAERVLMLEKAPESGFGGNARYSTTMFRTVHKGAAELREFLPEIDENAFGRLRLLPYTAEMYVADLERVTMGRVNPRLARTLAEESNAGLHWLLDQGVRWEATGTCFEVDGEIHFADPGYVLSPVGGGPGLLGHWQRLRQQLGIELQYESEVRALLGSDRRVEGVRVSTPDSDVEVRAASTILCSGGFQASPEKRARYLGHNADLMKVQGSPYDTGEVLMMAIELGAAPAGQWSGADAASLDGTLPDVESSHNAWRRGYQHGITVNIHGLRFLDEAQGETETRDTPWEIVGQPGAVAFQIFDQQARPFLADEYQLGAPLLESATLEGLAEMLHVDSVSLVRTVREYNAAILDDVAFDPSQPDGRATAGLVPRKSSWARRIDTPPFLGCPVMAGITFTFGGLEVTTHAQVMSARGWPIDGLYASGDLVGLFYHRHHLSASGQMRNVVFSRLAGSHAAQHTVVGGA